MALIGLVVGLIIGVLVTPFALALYIVLNNKETNQ